MDMMGGGGRGEVATSTSMQISVPFSWEVKPGVSRCSQQHHHRLPSHELNSNVILQALPLPPCLQDKPRLSTTVQEIMMLSDNYYEPYSNNSDKPARKSVHHEFPVRLPPAAFEQQPLMMMRSRSSSSSSRNRNKGGLRKKLQDDDPFVTAYKVCTETSSTRTAGSKMTRMLSKSQSVREKLSNKGASLFNFSCKQQHSCNVMDSNNVKLSI